MAEAKKTTQPKRAVGAARKATDKRTVGSALNPKKVTSPDASSYKMVPKIQVTKGKAGRPRKAH
jgi:hypothetical protein